jgi:hypothetical protein
MIAPGIEPGPLTTRPQGQLYSLVYRIQDDGRSPETQSELWPYLPVRVCVQIQNRRRPPVYSFELTWDHRHQKEINKFATPGFEN